MGVAVEGHYVAVLDTPVSFAVANINAGSVRTEFMLSMLGLQNEENRRQHLTDPLIPRARFSSFKAEWSHGPYLHMGRHTATMWFMNQTDSDYLLFIDSDIDLNDPSKCFDLIETMENNGVTVCSGVYYSNSIHPCLPGVGALVFEWGINDKNPDLAPYSDLIPLPAVVLDGFYPQSKPHPVDSLGAGFLAIHRSVFSDMLEAASVSGPPIMPWWNCQVIDGIVMGEDHVFCLRAKSVNHQPHVLPSITVDHIKSCYIRPNRES